VNGPTATGKSELKRCLVNGLREYSKTDAGRRYTLEWNVESASSEERGLAYGGGETQTGADVEDNWYSSPVQTHPLSVFPEKIRDDVLTAVNEAQPDLPVRVEEDLDPFSREAYDHLEERYRRQGRPDLFSAITDEKHLRVKNYVVDVGQGIGVLHSEDDGSPKERLVGSWMRGMLQELDSRGRKNPQAFSYDGVLSQGNGLLTVVEDAAQHADLLQKLLNVPDEGSVKLDKGIGMDVDTQLVVISNPDLEATLNQHSDRQGMDPLKALKRRLDKHEFRYLTNLSLETELIRRELTGETEVWTATTYDDLADRIREPVVISVKRGAGEVVDREFAPHTIEAAALYAVVSRLDDSDHPAGLDLVDKAILYDRGYLQDGDTRQEAEDFDLGDDADDGDAVERKDEAAEECVRHLAEAAPCKPRPQRVGDAGDEDECQECECEYREARERGGDGRRHSEGGGREGRAPCERRVESDGVEGAASAGVRGAVGDGVGLVVRVFVRVVDGDTDGEERAESEQDVRLGGAARDRNEDTECVHDADERELVGACHPDQRDRVPSQILEGHR